MIFVIVTFTVKKGVNNRLSMLRAIMVPDALINIAIPFIDGHVSELWHFKIFLDCVGYHCQ